MSRGTDLSAGHGEEEEEEQSEGANSRAPHQEDGPEAPDLPTGQEVTLPGAGEQKQREEGGSDCPHRRASVIQHPSQIEPRTRQEVMSPGGKTHRPGRKAQITREEQAKRCEHTAVSPVRRARTSVRRARLVETRHSGPFYFVGGANGANIVSSYCESRGWMRIYDKDREDFKLKWCETKSPSIYSSFRPGEQLMFQIPNNKVLTTKIGLLCSLREYERVTSKVQHGLGVRRLKMEEFIPTTFRMDIQQERDVFFSQQEDVNNNNQRLLWICKPSGLNQGRGIFLLKSAEDVSAFRKKLHEAQAVNTAQQHHRPQQAYIVQRYRGHMRPSVSASLIMTSHRYIQNPLLLDRRKFDVRSYLIIACTTPYMVFFRHGYVRLTCDLYDLNTNNMSAHLTNQCMQKKNPLYSLLKEDTVWSMESFNAYVNAQFAVAKDLPRDWVLGLFTKRMQQIMTQCFLSVKSKLDCRSGFFDLIGCDFMIDEDFNVWLLEMNCNPALHTNCSVLEEVIPSTVHETLDITLEIFNKCRCRQSILPLLTQKNSVLLFKGVFPPNAVLSCDRSRAATYGERSLKTSLKHQKEGPVRSGLQCRSLDSSENMLAGGEGKPQRPRRKKVSPMLNTIHTTTTVPPKPTHVRDLQNGQKEKLQHE